MSLPRIALLVISDGRGLKRAAVESFHANARRLEVATVIEVDDAKHELGFCGAIREGWARLRAVSAEVPFDYIAHIEEDWLFNRPFNVDEMALLLDSHPRIAQVALRRGAHGAEPAGGFLEQWPAEFHDRLTYATDEHRPHRWLEHRLFFTTNPSVYRRELVTDYDWPEAPGCEAEFTRILLAHDRSFAYWGDRDSAPWVTHVGQRAGTGY